MSSSPKMNRSGFVRAEENTSAKSARKSSGSGPGSRGGKRGKDNSKRASKAVKKAKRKTKKPTVCWSKRTGHGCYRPPAKKDSKGKYVVMSASRKRSYKNKPNGARARNDAKRAAGRQLPQVIAKMCAMEEWRTRMRFKRKGGFRVKNFAYCAVQMCIDCGWFKDQDLTPDKYVSGQRKCWHVVKGFLIASGFTCDHDFNKVKYSDDLMITFTHKDFLEGEDDKIASIVRKD